MSPQFVLLEGETGIDTLLMFLFGETWCCCSVRPSETQYVLLVLLFGETWRDSICDLAGVVSR